MKRIFYVAAVNVGVLSNVFISSPLFSQVLDSSGTTLDEVVFTANKFPNKSSLTGKVMVIITRKHLEQSGGRDLSQVLHEQAGVYIGGANSNAGKDKSVYLRGAAIQHTLITIDGIPVYDASGIGSNFDIRNISIDNIERIEIVKGSQSTLYGSDAIAGVINIITRKPSSKAFNAHGHLSYGSYQTSRQSTGFNGKKKAFDYHFNYSFFNTQGINEAADTTVGADKDGFTQHGFSTGFGWQPQKKIRLQPFFRFSNIRGDIDQGAFADDRDYTFQEKNYQVGTKNEFIIGKAQVNLVYHHNHLEREYVNDSFHIKPGSFDRYSRGFYTAKEHFVDAYVHSPLSKKIQLVAGADFRYSESYQEYASISLFGPYTPPPLSPDSLSHTQSAIYGALTFNSPKGFAFEAGNRLNFHSEYGTVNVYNLNPSYLWNERMKLFTNFSTGFRTPSLYQLFSEFGNRELKPEKAITWEGGVQFFSNNKKITGRAVYFIREIKDLIFFYTDFTTFDSWYINQDKQKDHGVELETNYNFSKGDFRVFYSYVNGEITTRQNNKDTTFFNLLRRPKHSYGIHIGYQLNSHLYFSSHLSVFGERKDAYFDGVLFQNVDVTLKGYALWDLYIQYAIAKNRLKSFADLRNITDSRYSEVAGFNTRRFTITGGIRFDLAFNKDAK